MKMPPDFCTSANNHIFVLSGKFKVKKWGKPPEVIFQSNDSYQLLHWKVVQVNQSYYNMSVFSKFKDKLVEAEAKSLHLKRLNLTRDTNFNVSILCTYDSAGNKTEFEINVNVPDGPNPEYNPDWGIDDFKVTNETWDLLDSNNVEEVIVKGDSAIDLDFAGFTSPGCLSLSPNGLVEEIKDEKCVDTEMKALCEHQSCYTKEGFECIFPFTYKDKQYHKCISEDVYQPWCPTSKILV